MPARKRGRPSLYTARLATTIVKHVANGVSIEDAARALGLGASTVFEWQSEKPEFAERLTRAREALIPKLVGVVTGGALKDPRLAMHWLARLRPDVYSSKRILQHEGNPEKPVDLRLRADEELAEVARKLAGMTSDELRALRRPSSA